MHNGTPPIFPQYSTGVSAKCLGTRHSLLYTPCAREAMKLSSQRPQISASFLLPGVMAFTDWSRVTVAKR